jgi:hypothetical protein
MAPEAMAASSPSSPASKKGGATTAAGGGSHSKNNTNKKANKTNNANREYNPLWKGYLYIVLSSLISLSSISNARQEDFYKGSYGVGVLFATVTFALGLIILILDRTKWLSSKDTKCNFDFAKTFDGKLEGYTLLVWTFWWVVGVAYITQVNGLAYVASNIYFSAWMSLASCIYTLNEWSTNKVSTLSCKSFVHSFEYKLLKSHMSHTLSSHSVPPFFIALTKPFA